MKENYVTLDMDNDYDLEATTDKAMAIRLKEYAGIVWFPKSQVKFLIKNRKLLIPQWLWDSKVNKLFKVNE